MAVGVTSYAYRWAIQIDQIDLFEVLDRSHEAGAEVLQICDNTPLDNFPDSTLDDITRKAAELGLTLEVGIKAFQPEVFLRNLEICKRIGSDLLRVALPNQELSLTFDDLVENFKAVIPEFRSAGVKLVIENHFHLTPGEIVRLIKAVDDPLMGACLDPVNSISRMCGSSETIAALAPFAYSVHLKDARPIRMETGYYVVGCPLGEGLVDLPGLVSAVREAGHKPNYLAETWMKRQDSDKNTVAMEKQWILDSITLMKRLLEE